MLTGVKGAVELRGLEDRKYSAVEYATGKNLGAVSGRSAHLPVSSMEICCWKCGQSEVRQRTSSRPYRSSVVG